ncbi:MAG: hypothetical protein A2046_15480 [Bacteroidetes bacterium GWA2_30_7]|nr:MAG: hypothetical protein A2046_15480 [Bacteroidetes bacterium GWA2_30_7]
MKKYIIKNSISKRLFKGVFLILIINIFIVIASLYIISILKSRSDKIVIEYHELDALHELKHSLNLFNNSIIESKNLSKTSLVSFLNQVNEKIKICNSEITQNHDKDLLANFIKDINNLSTNIENNILDSLSAENYSHFKNIYSDIIIGADKKLNFIIDETKHEINEHVDFFSKSYFRSNLIVIFLASILMLASYFWGLGFIKKILKEIKILITVTEKYIKGEHSVKIDSKFDDELGVLADSFNKMIETIDITTISRDYFDNIFQSIFDIVIVTDKNLIIKSLNNAVKNSLDYNKQELLEKNINILFKNNLTQMYNFKKDSNNIFSVSEKLLIAKNGKEISVIISVSELKSDDKNISGYVFVAHDITEKIDIENKINNIRRENLIALNDAQEEERLRIAKEIHDGLGQILTAIYFTIENKFKEKYINDNEYQKNILDIQNQIDNAITESRNIAHDLIPIMLKDFGLAVAVRNLIDNNYTKCGININFAVFNYDQRVDEKIEKALYRIIQEALSNIFKHSKAKNSNIQIIKHDDLISLTIDDDGIGFDMNNLYNDFKYNGIGLFSMKERVYAFKGVFQLTSEINKGTEILIDIPTP